MIKKLEDFIQKGKELNEDYVYVLFDLKNLKFIVTYNPFLAFKHIVVQVINIKTDEVKTFYDFSLDNAEIEFDYEWINNRVGV